MTNNKQFEWNEVLVRELVGVAHKDGYESNQKTDLDYLIEKFKKSKEVTVLPERKFLSPLEAYNEGFAMGVRHCEKYGIPPKPESLLNSKEDDKETVQDLKDVIGVLQTQLRETKHISEYKYTQQEVDTIREEAFMKGKEFYQNNLKFSKNWTTTPTNKEQQQWEVLTWFSRDGEVAALISGGIEGNLKAGYTIRSVRRLSDNEVFSIGDVVSRATSFDNKNNKRSLTNLPILSFSIREDNMIYAEVSVSNFFPLTLLEKQQQNLNTKVSTDNTDVACLSVTDFSNWYEKWYPNNPMKEAFLNGLKQLVNQKLKTMTEDKQLTEKNENWMEDKLNEFYNGAVENCIELVKVEQSVEPQGSTSFAILQNVINSLTKLKKK